ncbi:MAG: phosphatase PAP2 family protein [Flavobacteriaceae bacterium]|nr:MAG: phosphatase PAP2 family protein [Flavobacteriaceae bacterium]
MSKKPFLSGSFIIAVFIVSCKKETPITIDTIDFYHSVDKVTEIMVHDIFSPPVASRIYVYPNIAAYEIISQKGNFTPLSGQLKGLHPIPKPENENINLDLAALIAHIEISKTLIFSEEKISSYRDSLFSVWKQKNGKEFNTSKNYATKVIDHIKEWMGKDNYAQIPTMPKFQVKIDDPSRWQPTPPAYMNGIEPHWNKIRTLVLDSAAQFKPAKHPPFSLEKNSAFYKELIEVYDISREITKKGDSSEEIQIAQFWDCNPYISITRGHLMFATKKITPGAHWIGITKIACKKSKYDFENAVHAFTKTSIGLFEGFISCWDEKYRSNLVRPETLINEYIDDSWQPILQTPPFPEYTSGHSVISGAASVVLTSIFGENFNFDDDTEIPYGLPVRSFSSFEQAANEAAISRLYGGIHYKAAIDIGVKQGRDIGKYVVEKLITNPEKQ